MVVKLEEENTGNLMVWFEKDDKRVPLKTNLTNPGIEKVQYYLIAELKNEKIARFLVFHKFEVVLSSYLKVYKNHNKL